VITIPSPVGTTENKEVRRFSAVLMGLNLKKSPVPSTFVLYLFSVIDTYWYVTQNEEEKPLIPFFAVLALKRE